jgi:hypothetical protein
MVSAEPDWSGRDMTEAADEQLQSRRLQRPEKQVFLTAYLPEWLVALIAASEAGPPARRS